MCDEDRALLKVDEKLHSKGAKRKMPRHKDGASYGPVASGLLAPECVEVINSRGRTPNSLSSRGPGVPSLLCAAA